MSPDPPEPPFALRPEREPLDTSDLPPMPFPEIIALYACEIDRTLIRETLRLTPDERARKFMDFAQAADAMRGLALPADQRESILAALDARRDDPV